MIRPRVGGSGEMSTIAKNVLYKMELERSKEFTTLEICLIETRMH